MKATEQLMIGDWVYRPDCYDRVKEIRTEGIIGNDPLRGIVSISEVEPIPLTEEILRKNGWEYNDEDAKFFPQTWVGGGLKLRDADGGGYRIVVTSDYDDEDINDTPFILLYVHELQHALRLRRIEKEIKL